MLYNANNKALSMHSRCKYAYVFAIGTSEHLDVYPSTAPINVGTTSSGSFQRLKTGFLLTMRFAWEVGDPLRDRSSLKARLV